MSKGDKYITRDRTKLAEETRSKQMIEANHAEKIAAARQAQAEKIAKDAHLRATSETTIEGEPADRFNTPAIFEERLWRTIPASKTTLGRALNQLEQEGWQLVNITNGGIDAFVVVGARKMQYALPEEPDVEPASEETTSENAPDVVTDNIVETLRKEWALDQEAQAAAAPAESEGV
jgi:hypothetical protein